MREVYAALGYELDPVAEAAMRRWQLDRPKDKQGTHRYAAEDFGLSTTAIRDRMAGYIGRYGLTPDPGSTR